MGRCSSSATPGVRWRTLKRYAAGELLLDSSTDRMYAARLLPPCVDILLFQVRNLGGKKTPQDSVHTTPNHRRIEEIEELSRTANWSQSALRDLASSTSRFIGY